MEAKKKKKIFISVGEISADNYAAELIKLMPDFEWVGITGPKMREAGCKTVEPMENLSVVGFTEIIPKYFEIKKTFKKSVNELKNGVDLLIVVDYPGFNLKLLKEAKKLGIKTVYFIAPQVWAWGKGRIPKIVKYTDLLISIWPFEKDIYADYIGIDFKLIYVGHPLLDIVETKETEDSFKEKLGINKNRTVFGLLPGSREHEINLILPVMLESARLIYNVHKDLEFVIPATPNVEELVRDYIGKNKNLPIKLATKKHFEHPSYETMNQSKFSIITSGTATLEAAIIGNPFLIVYKVSPISYFIGKMLVKIPYIGLPNIIAGEEVVKEFIQEDCNPVNIANLSLKYLEDYKLWEKTKKDLKEKVKDKLGEKGALKRSAEAIIQFLNEKRRTK